jgi:hypothetical protein
MEIARILSGILISANMTAYLLRDNFDIQFWHKVLALMRSVVLKNISEFGVRPFDLINQNRPVLFWRTATPSEDLVNYYQFQHSSQEEVPKIDFRDVLYGSTKPSGKFEVLLWRSRIPPYYSYVGSCEIREVKSRGAERKRSMKKE